MKNCKGPHCASNHPVTEHSFDCLLEYALSCAGVTVSQSDAIMDQLSDGLGKIRDAAVRLEAFEVVTGDDSQVINTVAAIIQQRNDLRAQNFTLAAGQCIIPDGLLGDDSGGQYCRLARECVSQASEIQTLQQLRPHWAQGFSSDSVAAQVSSSALSALWGLLGVNNQTDAIQKLKEADPAQKDAEQQNADFNAAISHALTLGLEGIDFLRCWNEGDWDGCKEFGFEPSSAVRGKEGE